MNATHKGHPHARALSVYLTTVDGLAELSVALALHSFYYLMKDVSTTQTYANLLYTPSAKRGAPRAYAGAQ